MAPIVRSLARVLTSASTFAGRTGTGLLLFLGALGMVSPIVGWAYVWLTSGVNLLTHPDFWASPVRSLVALAFVGLLFAPLELIGALLQFSGPREHIFFILLTALALILWVMGMLRLSQALRRRRPPAGRT